MKLLFPLERLARIIIMLAVILFIGIIGYGWYHTQTQYFISGSPPKDLLTRIEPKTVPYDQIKPPAVSLSDIFLTGSATSSVGIIFYGDYADPVSDKLLLEIQNKLMAYNGRVRLIWHYLPKTTNNGDASFEAAVLSKCSRLMDPAWTVHQVFIHGADKPLTKFDVENLAYNISNDQNNFYACLKNATVRAQIALEAETARGDGIDKAPFIFVGTQAIPSQQASSTKIFNVLQNYLQ